MEKFGKNAKEALRVFNLNRKYKYGKVGIMIKVLKKRGGTEDARAQGRECRQKNVEASFRYFGEKTSEALPCKASEVFCDSSQIVV